jgi:hypothetical protein
MAEITTVPPPAVLAACRTRSSRQPTSACLPTNDRTDAGGFYSNILSVLDNPVSSDTSQCVDLADAVGNSPWGTGNFSADC